MFIYSYAHVGRPYEEVEPDLLRMLPGLRGWADAAYRDGEHLYAELGVPSGRIAKTVELTVGAPTRGVHETWIPIEWEATGLPKLFPRMQGEVVVAPIGPSLTQVSLRGRYIVPFGKVGAALDRTLLHRVAEASVKAFVDRIAAALHERADARAGRSSR